MKSIKNYTGILIFVFFLFVGLFWFASAWIVVRPKIEFAAFNHKLTNSGLPETEKLSEKELKKLVETQKALSRKIEKLTPRGAFLVINTTDNTFSLYEKNQVVRKGKCSTGSFIHLEVDSTQSFLFETPKGALTVRGKITNPVWRKPDWAFIEEGIPVPPANHPSRYEKNVLGDYALSLGNGYLIHGTLYQRLLGMPVTHGCVRLNDADLEAVYSTLNVGSKVYIY